MTHYTIYTYGIAENNLASITTFATGASSHKLTSLHACKSIQVALCWENHYTSLVQRRVLRLDYLHTLRNVLEHFPPPKALLEQGFNFIIQLHPEGYTKANQYFA